MLDANDLRQVLDRLEGVEERTDHYVALCPAHSDTRPSLSVTKKGKKVLLHCHAGCEYDAIVFALEGRENGWRGDRVRVDAQERQIVATYDYRDEDGNLLFQSVRYKPKDFRQRRKANGKWVNDLKGVRRVLFRLPEVVAAIERDKTIYVLEGEKDVEAIVGSGGEATCNPGGAGKWRDEYSQYLAGADVVVVADKDDAGRKHAREVKRSLVGVARSVRVVEARTGKDAADHLDAGHSLDEFVPADRFEQFDLASLIEGGIEDPPFVVGDVLYREKSHALLGEPGDGKTLLAIAFSIQVMASGECVAWFDEENGPAVIASRLVALGASIEDVRDRFAYFPFSEPTLDDATELVEQMRALEIAVVFFDSGADVYVAAGLDENSNMDMTRWAREFSQRLAREHGIASVVLEHVAKNSDSSYQRGAGAKKAKVDASWRLEVRTPFDHETVGEISLIRAKDRLAHLPRELRYRIGGDGKGTTVVERIAVENEEERREADDKAKRDSFRREAIRVLRRERCFDREHGLSQRQLTALLSPAPQAFKNEVVQALASDPTTPVSVGAGARNALIYWVREGESDD